MPYTAPVDEYLFLLTRCTSALRLAREGGFPNLSEDLLPAIVGEAGKFASGPLAAIDRSLDRVGARYVDGAVVTAPGHRELYRDFVAGGWMGLAQPEDRR